MKRGRGYIRNRPAFTLLELILALSLSVVILGSVAMAINVYLTGFDRRRDQIEESLLARSVLRLIADDIRAVVVHYEQDVSGVEQMLGENAQSAAEGLLGEGATEALLGEGEGVETLLPGDEESINTQSLSTMTTLPTMPGIYGNQYELQIDLSKLPRIDEFQAINQAAALGELPPIPSDIKTVTYFLQTGVTATGGLQAGALSTDLSQLDDPNMRDGLVRRELDRAVAQWGLSNASLTTQMQAGELLAPEVISIEFQYFDGVEWRLEWDTEVEQALPVAIEIVLVMRRMSVLTDETAAVIPTQQELQDTSTYKVHRLVVALPVSLQPSPDSAATEEAGAEFGGAGEGGI